MGRDDNRRGIKMRRRKSQAKFKARLIRAAAARGKVRKAEKKKKK